MYEKNGIVTSPVVDAKCKHRDKENLAVEERSECGGDLFFCETLSTVRQRPTGEEAANPSPQSRSLSTSITGGEDGSWR